ncbi:MAG: hypothetical protein MRY21_01195 [Simkaniaceae bacterium]|nr:hypothetical protein [Simkaniaceae bacterium]
MSVERISTQETQPRFAVTVARHPLTHLLVKVAKYTLPLILIHVAQANPTNRPNVTTTSDAIRSLRGYVGCVADAFGQQICN